MPAEEVKVNYYASGSYFDQDGLLNVGEENLQRFTATAKINSEITDWLKFNMNMRFTREDYVRPSALTDYFTRRWPLKHGLFCRSTIATDTTITVMILR